MKLGTSQQNRSSQNSTCQPPYLFNSRFQSRLRTPSLRQSLTKIFGNFFELGCYGGLSIFSRNWNPTIPDSRVAISIGI